MMITACGCQLREIPMAERRSPRQILAIGISYAGVILALSFGAWWLWRALWQEPAKAATQGGGAATKIAMDTANSVYDLAARIAKDVNDALHFRPEIKVSDVVVIQGQRPILEFATEQRLFAQTHTAQGTWMGSTWVVEIQGEYVAKAGFVLDNDTWIDVDKATGKLTFHTPQPSLLSNEMKKYSVLRDENGLWNKIAKEDREKAVNDMNSRAREASSDMELFAAARTALEQQLRPKFEAAGVKCVFVYENGKK